MTTIIEDLKTFLKTCPHLSATAILSTDHLGSKVIHYSIVPLSGPRIVSTYLDESSDREFPFAFQAALSTADELARLENIGFYELLSDWFELVTETEALPVLGTKKTATSIEALGSGSVFEQGESNNGVYQILCKLSYHQIH